MNSKQRRKTKRAARIYVVSKIKHAYKWLALRGKGYPIISSWIDDGDENTVNFAEAWPRYMKEAASATHVLVYAEPGEELKGGLFEIGAALGAGASVILVVDSIPSMRTLAHHPAMNKVRRLEQALELLPHE